MRHVFGIAVPSLAVVFGAIATSDAQTTPCSVTPDGSGLVTVNTATNTNPYQMAYHIQRTIGWRAGCYCNYPCVADHSDPTITVYFFNGCTALTSISIPSTIEVITSCSFNGTSLTSLSLPDSVYYMGSQAFANNANLAAVSLSNSLTAIPEQAFQYNTALSTVTIPSFTFQNQGGGTLFFQGLIGESAFQGCTSLTSVIIQNGTTFIDEGAFEGCIALNNVDLPISVSTISEGAFANCTSLNTMILQNTNFTAVNTYSELGLSRDAFNGSACTPALYVHPGVVNCGAVVATAAPTPLPTPLPTFSPSARPTTTPTAPTAAPTLSPTSFVTSGSTSTTSDSTAAVAIGAVVGILLLIVLIVLILKRQDLKRLLHSHNLLPAYFEDESENPSNFVPQLPKHIQLLVDMDELTPEQAHRVIAEDLTTQDVDDDCDIMALPTLPRALAKLIDEGVVDDYQADMIWTSVLPKHLKKLVDNGVLSPAQAHKIAIDSDREEHISNSDASKVLPPLPPYLIAEVRNGLMSREQADATWDAELADLIRADLALRAAEATARDKLAAKLAQRKKWGDQGVDSFGNPVDDEGVPIDPQEAASNVFSDDMDFYLPSALTQRVDNGTLTLEDAEKAWFLELCRASLAVNSDENNARNKLKSRLQTRLGMKDPPPDKSSYDSSILPTDFKEAVQSGKMTQEVAAATWDADLAAMIRADLAVKAAEAAARDRLKAKLAQRKQWNFDMNSPPVDPDGNPAEVLETVDSALHEDEDDFSQVLPPDLAQLVTDGKLSSKDAEEAWLAELRRLQLALDSVENNARMKLLARLRNRLGSLPEDSSKPLPSDLAAAVASGDMSQEQAAAKWEADLAAMIRADLAVKSAQATARDRLRAKMALRKQWTVDTNGDRVAIQRDSVSLPSHFAQLVSNGTLSLEDAERAWLAALCRVDLAVDSAEATQRNLLLVKLQNRTKIGNSDDSETPQTVLPFPSQLAADVDAQKVTQEEAVAIWEADLNSLIRADLAVRAAQATAQDRAAARLAQRRKWDAVDVPGHGNNHVSAAPDEDENPRLPTRLAEFVSHGTMSQEDAERAWTAELRRVDLQMNSAQNSARDKLLVKLHNRTKKEGVPPSTLRGAPTPGSDASSSSESADVSGVTTALPTPLERLVDRGNLTYVDAEKVWLAELTALDTPQDPKEATARQKLIESLHASLDERHAANSAGTATVDPFSRIESLKSSGAIQVPLAPPMLKLVRSGMLTREQAQEAWEEDLKNLIRADLSYRTAQSMAEENLRIRLAQRNAVNAMKPQVGHTSITIDKEEGNRPSATVETGTDSGSFDRTKSAWRIVQQTVAFAPSQISQKPLVVQPSVLPPHLRGLVHKGVITQEQALKTVHAELGRCEVAVSSAEALAQTTLQAKLAARMAMASHAHTSKATGTASPHQGRHTLAQTTSALNSVLQSVPSRHNRRVHPIPPHPHGALPPLKGAAPRVTHAPPIYVRQSPQK